MKDEYVQPWNSIQTKYAATYLLVIAAVVILLNTYPVIMAQDMVFRSKETNLQSQTSVVASALAVSEVLSTEGVEQSMLLLEDVNATRLLVTDSEGYILYDSSKFDQAVGSCAMLGEIISALQGYDVFRSEYSGGAFRSRAAAPIQYRGDTIGAVYLYEYDSTQARLLLSIQSNLRSLSIVICLAALVLSFVFSKALSRGINNLLRAIRTVRQGEYNHRVEPQGKDELAMLAEEFNQLTDRLQTTEEARRRFVSDASHELKTPLASICLLTDSILQSDNINPDVVRDFVMDIGEEANRLTRISEHLLTLTRLDAKVIQEETSVDVGRMITRVERMLKPLADSAEVTIQCDLRTDCFISASDDEVYQIAFNLMENAIKYNLPGGQVIVTLRKLPLPLDMGQRIGECPWGYVILEVSDTGVGIPAEDRKKIFDRFYRVDKARSRAAGGTGLGLSIVSGAVQLHGGVIDVRARREGGTQFIVTFPACKEQEELE